MSVERESNSSEVETQKLVDWSVQENLFGECEAQYQLSDRDAMNVQADLLEPSMDYSIFFEQDPRDGDYTAAQTLNQGSEQEDHFIIDEM